MQFSGLRLVACAIAVMFALGACATDDTSKPSFSGFLGDYSKLKPDPQFDDALRWANPNVSLAGYSSFIVDPVVVQFAPNDEGTALSPDELKELTDHFRNEAIAALSEKFKVVSEPGPGVLRIRTAITSVETTTPILNIHPAMKLTGLGLGGASMEAEAIDSVSGERIVAIVDSQQGNRMSIAEGLQTLGHAKQVMSYWVERAVANLEKVRNNQ